MQVLASNCCRQQRDYGFPHRRAINFSLRAAHVSGLVLFEEDAMKVAYSMVALTIAGVAVLYGASAAQSDRAFENVSVLRAQKIELVDARGVTRAPEHRVGR